MSEYTEPIITLSYVIGILLVGMYLTVIEFINELSNEILRMEQVMRINDKVLSKKGSL